MKILNSQWLGFLSVIVAPVMLAQSTHPIILADPQSRTVYEGDGLYFSVDVNVSGMTAQWRRNGLPVGSPLISSTANHSLTLWQVGFGDAGNYDVVLWNDSGSVTSRTAVLSVLLRPLALYSDLPSEQHVASGFPIDLNPFAVGSGVDFTWFKDGNALAGEKASRLLIPAARFTDSGRYQLRATNSLNAVTSRVAHIMVEPLLLTGPWDLQVPLENPAELFVLVESAAAVKYQWFYESNAISGATNRVLRIPAATTNDAGNYFVVASNTYGAVTSSIANLSVTAAAPTVTVSVIGYLTAAIGESVELRSHVSGGPPPTRQWRRNEIDLPGETGETLHLENMTLDDAGLYTVLVSNMVGTATSTPVNLQIVAVKPYFLEVPLETNVLADSIVTLRMLSRGGPPPKYQWRYNGAEMPGQTNASLYLPRARTNDSGVYELTARNSAGEARAAVQLNVLPRRGLDDWEWEKPDPQGSRLRSVAWGNGRYVAVGKSGKMVTSTNGANWTDLTVEASCDFTRVVFGNGRFVAAGWIASQVATIAGVPVFSPNLVLVSTNGLDWQVGQAPDTGYLSDLIYADGEFVAALGIYSPHLFRSADGLQWTSVITRPLLGLGEPRMAFGNGRFVLVHDGRAYYSMDLTNWTSTGFLNYNPQLTFGNGRFLAAGYDVAYSSEDGVVWEELSFTNDAVQSVFAGPAGMFISVYEANGILFHSTDGNTWTRLNIGTGQEVEQVIYANNRYLAVGEAGSIAYSADGLQWTAVPVANRVDFYGLTRHNNVMVLAGDDGTVMTSLDGRDWQMRQTPTSRNLHAVETGGGMLVATGRRGTILTSQDGGTWTVRNSGSTNYLERAAWGAGRWVVVGEQGAIVTSTDGATWTALNTGEPRSDHEGVAYGNGTWVVAGGYFISPYERNARGMLYSSTNGTDWIGRMFPLGVRLRDVTYGDGYFLAVGNNGVAAWSTNAADWVLDHPGYDNLRRAKFAAGRFVVVGNDGQIYSTSSPGNPAAWRKHRSRTSQNLHDLHLTREGRWVALGNNGMILRSGTAVPVITSYVAAADQFRLEFDPGMSEAVMLESSTNLVDWVPVFRCCVQSPVSLPIREYPARFFRIMPW